MRFLSLLTLLLVPALLPVHAATDAKAKPSATAKKKPATAAKKSRPAQPVSVPPVAVTATGEGQAGYVHYWLITAPDGEQEIQVGIELPDQRIAWSFPGLGVHTAAFVAEGEVDVHGRPFQVQHLYGLRPFAGEAAMRALRSNLMRRVTPLVRQRVPYCELNGVTPGLCMSCMGFVSQILFPGRTPEYANFPRNFPRIAGEDYHTTEDLLLYLTGLHALPGDAARKRRMAAIGGPPALQEELARLVPQLGPAPAATVANAKTPAKRPVRAAPKTAIRRTG
ncbi:MAG: hypothetical protein KIT13_03085 [Burkholderiales bacterium]|nr:hypothetical protein [Burkholderiales bacterium]